MKRISVVMMSALMLIAAMPAPAQRREGERERAMRPPGHWREHEIHRFHERDFDTWRGGRWYHGHHDGRLGWWWIAAGMWYFYPAPVYPYPDPYLPPVVVVPRAPVVVAPQPPVAAEPAPPPVPQYWYYCASQKGYYPYVPTCPEAWKQVPAQPPQTPPH